MALERSRAVCRAVVLKAGPFASLERLAQTYGIGVHELFEPELPKTNFPTGRVEKARIRKPRYCRVWIAISMP